MTAPRLRPSLRPPCRPWSRGLPGLLRLPTLLGLVAATPLLGACASGGTSLGGTDAAAASSEERAVRVSLIGYGRPSFVLVSNSHTSRVELYSDERGAPSRKVQTDAVMGALVDHLDDLGMAEFATPGRAPRADDSRFLWAFEVEDGDVRRWWPLGSATPVDEQRAFAAARSDFIDLFNLTQAFQSVDNEVGSDYFDVRNREARSGR